MSGSFCSNFNEALIPAIKPCPAASSYPLVPFIWPAVNKFFITFVSSDGVICKGSIASYSIAYAYFEMIAFSKPLKLCTIFS